MALLFSQIAVAAYACPAIGERAGSADAAAMAGMPCAEMMAAGVPLDPEQPTLCMQHCQFGSTTQVVDHVPAVFAPVTAFPALFTVSVDERMDLGLSSWAEASACATDLRRSPTASRTAATAFDLLKSPA